MGLFSINGKNLMVALPYQLLKFFNYWQIMELLKKINVTPYSHILALYGETIGEGEDIGLLFN